MQSEVGCRAFVRFFNTTAYSYFVLSNLHLPSVVCLALPFAANSEASEGTGIIPGKSGHPDISAVCQCEYPKPGETWLCLNKAVWESDESARP